MKLLGTCAEVPFSLRLDVYIFSKDHAKDGSEEFFTMMDCEWRSLIQSPKSH